MKLQTKIPLEKASSNLIDHNSKLLLLGSCFVENIGNKFEYFKFQNLQNPFGILFNPVVIKQLVKYSIEGKLYTENDVFFNNERWHCYDVHSEMSSTSKEELLQNLNTSIQKTSNYIKECSHLIITLGSAWVYKHIETNQIVANCHKIPQKQFNKELLSVDEIYESLKSIVDTVQTVNPKVLFIFTVSPVRHLKDGFVENQQSKAHLISATHQLLSLRAESRSLNYFPSYEIMMDELRDYRFYAEDMIHPNKTAINYIWEKVKQNWILESSHTIMDEVESIQKGLNHKPLSPESVQYIEFRKSLIGRARLLQEQYEGIKFCLTF